MKSSPFLTIIFTSFASILLKISSSSSIPFRICPGSESSIKGKDFDVGLSDCNSSASNQDDGQRRCPLFLGSSVNLTLKFTPETSLSGLLGIERVIMAKMPTTVRGKALELDKPYGTAVPINNQTVHDLTGKTLSQESNQLVVNDAYTHTTLFPVTNSVPKSNMTLRYILREKVPGNGRKRSDWKSHPGTLFACLEIPVEVRSP